MSGTITGRSIAHTVDSSAFRHVVRLFAPAFLLLGLGFWLPGCSRETAGNLYSVFCEGLTDYYPLDVENYWIYRVDHLSGSREIKERVIYRKNQVYHLQTTVDGFPTKDEVDILQVIENDAIIDKEGVAVLKKPMIAGETWVSLDMVFEIVAKGRPVSVPAGDFTKTLEVTWTSKFAKETFQQKEKWPTLDPGPDPYVQILKRTYAKGVGIVKEEYDTITPDGEQHHIYTAELIQYNLRDRSH